jgi:predicted small secreted protein
MTARTFRMFLIPLGLFAMAACNTVSGVGKDVEAGGKAIQEGSDKVEKELSE